MAMTEERQTSKGGNQNEPELDVSSSTVRYQETEPGAAKLAMAHAEEVEKNVPHENRAHRHTKLLQCDI